jgi:hypothetical protein
MLEENRGALKGSLDGAGAYHRSSKKIIMVAAVSLVGNNPIDR